MERNILMSPTTQTGVPAPAFKAIDGLRIRYISSGRRDGDPILLLSPLPESLLAFLPTWDIFSELGPIVAVDLPSFGLSETRPELRAPEALGEFVIRIIEGFEL